MRRRDVSVPALLQDKVHAPDMLALDDIRLELADDPVRGGAEIVHGYRQLSLAQVFEGPGMAVVARVGVCDDQWEGVEVLPPGGGRKSESPLFSRSSPGCVIPSA